MSDLAETDRPMVSLIAAMDEGRVIGRDNALPWHMPADLAHFKRLTMGRTVIMGRRTWQSMHGPLPNRRNMVLSRRGDFQAPGAEVFGGPAEAIAEAKGEQEVFILGGQKVYEQTLPLADRIYLTLIHARFEGDTWFPPFEDGPWRLVERQDHSADDKNPHACSFLQYERVE